MYVCHMCGRISVLEWCLEYMISISRVLIYFEYKKKKKELNFFFVCFCLFFEILIHALFSFSLLLTDDNDHTTTTGECTKTRSPAVVQLNSLSTLTDRYTH